MNTMDQTEGRVRKCFELVFPELRASDIGNASMTSVSEWDSIRNATLFAVIEEEFDVLIAPEAVVELTSFQLVVQHLQSSGSGAGVKR